MEHSSFLVSLSEFRSSKVLKSLTLLIVVGLAAFLIPQWHELTPCLQRQGVVVLLALLWWTFRSESQALFIIEIFHFFFLFIYTQKMNFCEVHIMNDCSFMNDVILKIVSHIYFFFYGYYLGGLFTLVLIWLAFSIYGFYERQYGIPRNVRVKCIKGKEFDVLGTLKFSKSSLAMQSQAICSICLVEFEDQEQIIKLPVCNHCYHRDCLKKWLLTHHECPYCRANILANQQTLKTKI